MIDASLVPVPTQHIGSADKAIVEQGATPVGWSPAQSRQKNTEAAWVKKHGKSHFKKKMNKHALISHGLR